MGVGAKTPPSCGVMYVAQFATPESGAGRRRRRHGPRSKARIPDGLIVGADDGVEAQPGDETLLTIPRCGEQQCFGHLLTAGWRVGPYQYHDQRNLCMKTSISPSHGTHNSILTPLPGFGWIPTHVQQSGRDARHSGMFVLLMGEWGIRERSRAHRPESYEKHENSIDSVRGHDDGVGATHPARFHYGP